MRRFTSRLLVVSLVIGILVAPVAMATDSSAGDTLSFADWVILMSRIGIPPG
jgi:flagellar biosynthesis protein FliQ